MMDEQHAALLDTDIQGLMIPAHRVAYVGPSHSLEHALLILIKSGYSAIPVLDASSIVKGTISKTMILDSILGIERIEFDTLMNHTVLEVMSQDVPRVLQDASFFRALELSINHPFVCIEDESGVFVGLLTRRTVLAVIYHDIRNSFQLPQIKTHTRQSPHA